MIRETTKGLNEAIRHLDNMSRVKRVAVQICAKKSSGKKKLTQTRSVPESRTAYQQAAIWKSHMKTKRRNPVFTRGSKKREKESYIEKAIAEFMRTAKNQTFMQKVAVIGNLLIQDFKSNILDGRSEAGKMKPLKKPKSKIPGKRYKYVKEALYGKGVPVLVRSGEMLNSLYVKVKRL